MFDNLGTGEVLIVSFVLLILFGGKKLNEIAHGLGKSQKEYEQMKKEIEEETSNQNPQNPESQGGGTGA